MNKLVAEFKSVGVGLVAGGNQTIIINDRCATKFTIASIGINFVNNS